MRTAKSIRNLARKSLADCSTDMSIDIIIKMDNNFDYDNGNGVYDVVSQEDLRRWKDQKRKDYDRERRENATKQELADPLFEVPY